MKRILLLLLAVFLAFGSSARASDTFMHEAERRAQRSALAERAMQSQTQNQQAPKSAAKAQTRHKAAAHSEAAGAYAYEEPGTIIIETQSRTLHFVQDDGSLISYPIAVGREGAQWTGVTKVTGKRKNPEWRPTPNMRKRDPKLPAVVPPGPSNPLGVRAIYLAEGYLRIHGTNNPKSIGSAASSGCFRMYNEDVIDLYERVTPGAKVMVLR